MRRNKRRCYITLRSTVVGTMRGFGIGRSGTNAAVVREFFREKRIPSKLSNCLCQIFMRLLGQKSSKSRMNTAHSLLALWPPCIRTDTHGAVYGTAALIMRSMVGDAARSA
jgi:hypothetical protein